MELNPTPLPPFYVTANVVGNPPPGSPDSLGSTEGRLLEIITYEGSTKMLVHVGQRVYNSQATIGEPFRKALSLSYNNLLHFLQTWRDVVETHAQ